ncbi:MAG: hypothetical protein KKD77_23155 [Gammaproteobacteria bacterium]|nr:hypothetical protein [Gammaproteobacteria bacterium]
MTNNMADLNRATLKGYQKYMLARPDYFENLTDGKEATKKNIGAMFQKLKHAGLVAAANVSKYCKCKYCQDARDEKAAWRLNRLSAKKGGKGNDRKKKTK